MDTTPPNKPQKFFPFKSKKQATKHFSPLSFAAGMLIVCLGFGAIYVLMPHGKNNKNNLSDEQKNTADTTKDVTEFYSEHFYKIHHHKHIDKDAEPIVLLDDETAMLEKGNLTERQKKLLQLLPDAPVIYLHDLKITEYATLYFTSTGEAIASNGHPTPRLINQAMQSFLEKDFKATIISLQPLLDINKEDPNALFYIGASYFYEKNYVQAIIMLNRVADLPNNIFKQEAQWYKALCFIDLNKKEDATTMLQHIIDLQGFYSARAKSTLNQLKK